MKTFPENTTKFINSSADLMYASCKKWCTATGFIDFDFCPVHGKPYNMYVQHINDIA